MILIKQMQLNHQHMPVLIKVFLQTITIYIFIAQPLPCDIGYRMYKSAFGYSDSSHNVAELEYELIEVFYHIFHGLFFTYVCTGK